MGEGDFTWNGIAASAADECRLGGGVMGSTKRWRDDQAPTPARCSPEHCRLNRLCDLERWEDPNDSPRQHGLARSRRAMHQEVVTAGRRHLECPPRHRLAPDIGQVWCPLLGLGGTWSCRLNGLQTSPEKAHRVRQAGDAIGGGAGDRCRLTDDGGGDQARHVLPGTQHAGTERVGSRPDSAVERKLADDDGVAEWRDLLAGGEDAQGDRKVVVRPSLGEVRRCEVHRDRPIGKTDPGRGDRGPNPVFGLPHGGVGETGELECLALTPDMGFDPDRSRLTSHEGYQRWQVVADNGETRRPESHAWNTDRGSDISRHQTRARKDLMTDRRPLGAEEVASTPFDAKPPKDRKPALHTLEGVNSMLRAGHGRIADGEYHLPELAALAETKAIVEAVIDDAVRWLGANEQVSYREFSIALGVSRQAVENKWPGVSGREAGGQPSRLR